MDAIEAILSRRSIRSFKHEPVSDYLINKLIRAAMNAPSAGNEQPWHFVVIHDQELIDEVPKYHPSASFITEAMAAILVCADLELEKHEGFWVQDCSAATQNILLAARALGLGSVWLGIFPRDERIEGCRKACNLPENVMPFSLVPIGYPAQPNVPVDRYDYARVHINHW